MMQTSRSVAAALILIFSTLAIAQDIEVSVDRSELARGETLIFTIRVFDQRQGMQLDLTPLTENFDVLGTRTSSQIRSINGVVEAWTDYIITLFPLNEGELNIPALSINNAITDAITIVVVNEGPRSNQSSEELFLEIEVNKDSVYVQEQLLFTVRLFYTINGIRNPQFTELEMPDTVIQLIGSPNQYEKLIDGVRYGVYEKRYVIFPQRSGTLEIPDILFRGEVTDGSSNFVFRNLNTRRVTAFIEGIDIAIKERPLVTQNSRFWLPVANLSLQEQWSSDLDNLQVGDTLIRTITMVADGLDGAVLPPFSAAEIDGANLYPDPPTIERTFVDGSIVGTRVESTSIVATDSGIIEIPQISIPWWNIDTDQLDATVVPATRLEIATIEGVVPAEQSVASTEDLEELLAAVPVVDQDMIDAQAEAEFIEVNAAWLKYSIMLAFVVVALSIYKLVIAPSNTEIAAFIRDLKDRLVAKYSPENNEQVAFGQLRAACRGNDLILLRTTLKQWCNHFIDKRRVHSMEDILQQHQAPELHAPAQQIQSTLFSHESGQDRDFDTRALIILVVGLRRQKLRQNKRNRRQQQYALPPLYKTS
jgi:hypothetical protein